MKYKYYHFIIRKLASGNQQTALPFSIQATNYIANLLATDLTFEIKPIKAISTGGYIEIRIPEEFGLSGAVDGKKIENFILFKEKIIIYQPF